MASGGSLDQTTTTTFGDEGSVDGQYWVALFDGAGHLCAAKAADRMAGRPVLGGSSVTFITSNEQPDGDVIRRMQLAELAQ